MNQVEVGQKSYLMPPQVGLTVAHFLTVADIERSLRFYETVFGSTILSRGDSKGAPGYIQIANTWLIVNVGGGPTPDKPSVTLSVPADPDSVSSFMNIRVAALGLLAICLVALLTNSPTVVASYKPIDSADRVDDWLYQPEMMYALMLLYFIASGAGPFSVDQLLKRWVG